MNAKTTVDPEGFGVTIEPDGLIWGNDVAGYELALRRAKDQAVHDSQLEFRAKAYSSEGYNRVGRCGKCQAVLTAVSYGDPNHPRVAICPACAGAPA